MTPAGRAVEILLIEDDPGDELITREALEHNKFQNRLHVAHDGEEGLNFLYRFPLVGGLLSQRLLYLVFGFFFIMLVFSRQAHAATDLYNRYAERGGEIPSLPHKQLLFDTGRRA